MKLLTGILIGLLPLISCNSKAQDNRDRADDYAKKHFTLQPPDLDDFWTTNEHGREVVDTLMIKSLIEGHDKKKTYSVQYKKEIVNKVVDRIILLRKQEDYIKNHIKT